MSIHAIILCAGSSQRMNGNDKILALLLGEPVLIHSLRVFEGNDRINDIVIVANKDNIEAIRNLVKDRKKVSDVVLGGVYRSDSVRLGVQAALPSDKDILVIHNGANPLLRKQELEACIDAAIEHGASALGFPARDSLRRVENEFVKELIDRTNLWQMQTPQCLRYSLYKKAIETDKEEYHTDETSIMFSVGNPVKIVPCAYANIKITTQEDLDIAEGLMSLQKKRILTGIGEDSHRFAPGKKLVLGGALIRGADGLLANSDGDVVLHSLCNAVMSALGKRSLGTYADSMAEKEITDSKEYVRHVLAEANAKKYRVCQVSFSIEAARPPLEQYHDAIKESLCKLLSLTADRIGLTFTTGEGLSVYGRGEGMRCSCIVSLEQR